jgi:hypothetical protein
MKKTASFILAAGFIGFLALPVNAQKKVSLQEIQKENQKIEAAQAASTVAPTNPATATPGGVQTPGTVAPPPTAVPLTCTWDVTDYDFGKNVVQLKPATATFTMKNAGKDPVTITLVQPSCGCTSPKYTKEPIKPGEKGEVTLTYDARISGFFSKSAQVKLSDGQKYVLTIKGEVQKDEAGPTTAPAAVVPIKK